mmetsp:Transcript_58209/g.165516  ORF Transcript_58209/g.165516 Transcript_58209/m.165516 type:complete len:259 (-) Transcript_58209:243-1019(-)
MDCPGVTFSPSRTTLPITVNTDLSCPTICDPTAPRLPTTHSWERFRTQAATLDRARDAAIPCLFFPPESIRMGACPSAAADHASIRAAEGRLIQARSAQGSNLSLAAPVSIFSCSAALSARAALQNTARMSPGREKRRSPKALMPQPSMTRHVGGSSFASKPMPSITTMSTERTGCMAISISVNATEHRRSTWFPKPMQMANDSAMGMITRKNSRTLGTGRACLFLRRRQASRPKATTAPDRRCTPDTKRGKLKPHST